MSRQAEPHILACDISDKKRLRRVHKLLKSWGIAVQYSVFGVDLTDRSADRLFEALKRITDPEKDDVRLYRVGKGSWQGRAPMGDGIILTGSPTTRRLDLMASRKGESRADRDGTSKSRKKRTE